MLGEQPEERLARAPPHLALHDGDGGGRVRHVVEERRFAEALAFGEHALDELPALFVVADHLHPAALHLVEIARGRALVEERLSLRQVHHAGAVLRPKRFGNHLSGHYVMSGRREVFMTWVNTLGE
jgi:hypothetical protein